MKKLFGIVAIAFLCFFGSVEAAWDRENLEKLFESQLIRLNERGCPIEITDALRAKKEEVISRALALSFSGGHVPLLPVITNKALTHDELMLLVRHLGWWGNSDLDQYSIYNHDGGKIPESLYYIFDVEDGRGTVGVSPHEAVLRIGTEKPSRLPLTMDETFALATHTDVLSSHFLWAARSYFSQPWLIPRIYFLDENGYAPHVSYSHFENAHKGFGTPSRAEDFK